MAEPPRAHAPGPRTPSGAGVPADARAGAGPAAAPALELLVHGVGGATPQAMLGDPRTVRVTGDAIAGLHRRTQDAGAEARAARPGGHTTEPVPEAYCWSGLTSGNGARALWLVLLPFMIANLAHWMRPAAPRGHRAHRLYSVLVRLIALSLTVLLTAAACEVALDLVAWQCAASAACAQGASWLTFLAEDTGGWWSLPGRRLVVAALFPLAVTALLWWLARRTWSAYESAPPAPRACGTPVKPPDEDDPSLSLPGFWYGRRLVARLRAAHTAAALLTVTAALLTAAAQYDGARGGAAASVGTVLALLCAACWAAVLVSVMRRGRSESEIDERRDPAVTRWLPWSALTLLLASAVHTGWDRPGWRAGAQLPGTGYFAVSTLLQGGLVLALAGTAAVLHRRAPAGERSALAGFGGPAVALLACALGGLFSGGVAQRVAEWLAPGSTAHLPGAPIAGPPVVLTWQAAVIPVVVLAVAVFAVSCAVRVWRLGRGLVPDVARGYPDEAADDPARSGHIASAIARAGLTDSAPVLVGTVAALTALLGAAAVAGALISGAAPQQALDGAPAPLAAAADLAQGVGSWLMGGLVIALVTTGRRAYRDAGARRTVGVLWDVGTFWPRATHPFAPPCYAERAVPDLTWRMCTWTELTGGRLVISGHSQGSVLAAAAVWQLDRATRSQVALLTYGSPLERLYGRWFPAWFGPTALGVLADQVDHWRNLWRLTDPIGGPVKVADVDEGPLRDPLSYGRTPHDPLPAPLLGHSEYQADPAFARTRAELLTHLSPLPPTLPGATPPPRPRGPASPGHRADPAAGAGPAADAAPDEPGGAAAEPGARPGQPA
ncbi:hypothetical protein JJV70_08255 [Streptomyces sp. JJ66]|uniref:hypothetical protein n=1 Tax=Streptomyces sp. JJ66 TaxID=2803843 RepID=UPI001C58D993|nr:hypothetical protein [Streptomyces sp. JJ66]MBW1602105.1 hypothetical protein [Streptomyces sp. JJ66]